MTIYNRNFAKPAADGTPLYGPMPLAVEIPHHDEWDESVLDPETGEPTGETEHKTRDWVEKRTVIHPTARDFALMGYLPLVDEPPADPPQGQHYKRSGTIRLNDDHYTWVYILIDDPPAPPRIFSKLKLEAALFEAGILDRVDAFIDSQTVTNEFGQMMPLRRKYTTANEFSEGYPLFVQFKGALQELLGWTDEQTEAILSQCVKEDS